MPRNWYLLSVIKYLVLIALVLATIYKLPTTNYQLIAATPLETAQSDYNFQYSKLRDSYEKFTAAKSSYQSFKTANSKDQAYIAAKDYLNQAIELYLTYFALVNEYRNAIKWQDQQTHEQVAKDIESIKSTYLQMQQAVNTSLTLEDVNQVSLDFSKKQEKEIDPTLYKILCLFEIAEGKELLSTFDSLVAKLGQNNQNFKNSPILKNWQSEISTIRQQAQSQIDQAQAIYNNLNLKTISENEANQLAVNTTQIKKILLRSNPLFLEAAKFL